MVSMQQSEMQHSDSLGNKQAADRKPAEFAPRMNPLLSLQRNLGNTCLYRMAENHRPEPATDAVSSNTQATASGRADFGLEQPRPLQDDDLAQTSDELRELQGDAGVTGGSDAGVKGGSDAGATVTPSATITIDNIGNYVDGATSAEEVKYNVAWSGGSQTDYIIVQWVKGYAKDPKGKFFKASLYGKTADINFADYQIDSVDPDPAYWSDPSGRWNYNVDGPGKFSGTDSPIRLGDADDKGAQARLDFKTGVYKSADVPTTTTGTISATPLTPLVAWSYYVTVLGGSKYDHK